MSKSKIPSKEQTSKNGAGTPAGSNDASPANNSFDSWAIVEVMGHNTFAGRVTEQSVGGASFIRVDVPAVPGSKWESEQPAFTKLIGAGSIYAITPCSEEVARRAALSFHARPITVVDIKHPKAIAAGSEDEL